MLRLCDQAYREDARTTFQNLTIFIWDKFDLHLCQWSHFLSLSRSNTSNTCMDMCNPDRWRCLWHHQNLQMFLLVVASIRPSLEKLLLPVVDCTCLHPAAHHIRWMIALFDDDIDLQRQRASTSTQISVEVKFGKNARFKMVSSYSILSFTFPKTLTALHTKLKRMHMREQSRMITDDQEHLIRYKSLFPLPAPLVIVQGSTKCSRNQTSLISVPESWDQSMSWPMIQKFVEWHYGIGTIRSSQ